MTEQYCRPATFEDLKQVIQSLNDNGVPYLLIGGYALFAHGYHRATEDIDLLIPATREAGEKLIKALMILPDQSAKDLPIEWFGAEDEENIRLVDEYVIDILFRACDETYESLQQYTEVLTLDGGIEISTVNLEGLFLTKQTVREKDKVDSLILKRALDAMKKV